LLFMLDGGRTGADWFRGHLTPEECEVLEERLASKATGSALAEKLHDAAYAMRTLANKQAAAAQGRLDQYRRPAPVTDGRSEASLQSELTALREQQAALLQQVGAAEAVALATARAHARQEAAREEITRLEAALGRLGGVGAPTADELAAAEAHAAQTHAAFCRADEAKTAAQARLAARTEQLRRFVELGSGCVLGDVECPMDDGARARIAQREAEAVAAQEDEAGALAYESDEAAATAGDAGDALQALRERQTAAAAMASDRARLADELQAATQRLTEALEEAAEAGPTEAGEWRQVAADVAAKIADTESALAAATQHREDLAAHERLTREAEAASAKADMLNQLVGKLAPDGLPAQAMGAVIGEVLGQINEVLAQFTAFHLTAEPGADFLLSVVQDGFATPVFALSESEELRVGAAIQVALAVLTGFGFVVVDAADRLDGKNRELLLRMLTQQELVQALVLATPAGPMTDKQRAALVAMGVKVVEIAGGEIIREDA